MINSALIGKILYDNPNGSNGNITLSDSVNNYKYIEIYYKDSNRGNSIKMLANSIAVSLSDIIIADNYTVNRVATYNVSNNKLELNPNRTGEFTIIINGTFNKSADNVFFIYKILGYK